MMDAEVVVQVVVMVDVVMVDVVMEEVMVEEVDQAEVVAMVVEKVLILHLQQLVMSLNSPVTTAEKSDILLLNVLIQRKQKNPLEHQLQLQKPSPKWRKL
jgi:hypothetical protein